MGKFKTIPQGKRYIRDVFSTFDDPTQAANIGIEQGWLQLAEKGLLGTKQVGDGGKFLSLTHGEYVLFRAGIANAVMALADTNVGLPFDVGVRQTAELIIQQTNGYYYDYTLNKPKSYVYKMVDQTIRALAQHNFLDISSNKLYLAAVDPVEFLASVYGPRLNHSTGVSSFRRMMLISLIGIESGIGSDFITERLLGQHRVEGINGTHLLKVLDVHGTRGTGLLLSDLAGRLYRMYDRLDNSQRREKSILEEHPEVLNAIINIPCIPEEILYDLFGIEVVKTLRDETSTLQPNFATNIIIRRGNIYFLGSHVHALELRNCKPEKSPILSMITDLYRKFTPHDCPAVAKRTRSLAHTLHVDGEYKPDTPMERRIMGFLLKKQLVDLDSSGDNYLNANDTLLKKLSLLMGNVLECGKFVTTT